MILYKEFIKLMEDKGYYHNGTEMINESSSNIKTFILKKGSVGKILELKCPNNTIISACGTTHPGGCEKIYFCRINCTNEYNKEPFQDLHYATKLTDKQQIVAEIIVSKILQIEPNKIDANYKEWSMKCSPLLKLIGSENPCEHIMWVGAYNLFSKDFLKESFNVHGNENMIFYAVKPNIDITKIKFEMKADILEKKS